MRAHVIRRSHQRDPGYEAKLWRDGGRARVDQ